MDKQSSRKSHSLKRLAWQIDHAHPFKKPSSHQFVKNLQSYSSQHVLQPAHIPLFPPSFIMMNLLLIITTVFCVYILIAYANASQHATN